MKQRSSLKFIRENYVDGCTECDLSSGRTNIVFGAGDPKAKIMFVGEAPGREEDLQGEPFVGRSGKLLDRINREILGLSRQQVYISNLCLCRPQGNRKPTFEEMNTCGRFLELQVKAIMPKIIVTLGKTPAEFVSGIKNFPITSNIGWIKKPKYPFSYSLVYAMFHPAYILRNMNMLDEFMKSFLTVKQKLETL